MTIPRARTRVALVEDHSLFAESLQIALSMEGHDVRRAVLPTTSRSPASVLSSVLRIEPTIVLLDLDLGPFGNGVQLVQPLVQAGVAVVVVTGSVDRARWGEALRYGARKVLPKSAPLNDILATIRRISDGRPVMTREERDDLMQEWHRHRVAVHELRQRLDQLTHREAEVLGRMIEGLQVRDIAEASVVSVATVRTQVKSILAKLEVSSQLAAVGVAHHAGWLPPPPQPRSSVS